MEQFERATVIRHILPHQEATSPDDARPLTLVERAAIFHSEAIRLQPGGDPTQVKFALKSLIADAQRLLGEVDGELNRQRKIERSRGEV